MITVKGFIAVDSLMDNNPSAIATFCELSAYSRSYTTDRSTIVGPASNDVEAIVFYANDGTIDVPVTQSIQDDLLLVGDWIAQTIKDAFLPALKNDMLNAMNDYLGPKGVTGLDMGVVVNDSGVYGPDVVTWTINGNTYTLWFTDSAFRAQYPFFLIDVIPPVATVDDLMRPFSELRDMISTASKVTLDARDAQQTRPVTRFSIQEHSVNERNVIDSVMLSFWGINVYGAAGFSSDEQRNAIRDYILANSAFSAFNWSEVLPSIFIPNEVYVIPMWDNMSIDDGSFNGLYSPLATLVKAARVAKDYAYGYDPTHVDTNVESMPTLYKSLASVVIGSSTNLENKYRLSELHPTYVLMHGHSTDWGLIATQTELFMRRLYYVIYLAEFAIDKTALPDGISRVVRGTNAYLTDTINGLTVFVLTKIAYMVTEGYTWLPEANSFYDPFVPPAPVDTGLTLVSALVSVRGNGTAAGKTIEVDPGALVSIEFKDYMGNIVNAETRVNVSNSYAVTDVDLTSLLEGTIVFTVTTVDTNGNTLTASAGVLYEIPEGDIVNVVVAYDDATRTVGITGDTVNVIDGSDVRYLIEDKVSVVKDGRLSSIGGTFTVDALSIDLPTRLINGNMLLTLRTMDISGNLVEWKSTFSAATPAGTISALTSNYATGSLTATTTGFAPTTVMFYSIVDIAGLALTGEVTVAADGTIDTGDLGLVGRLADGLIDSTLSARDYNADLITVTVTDDLIVDPSIRTSDITVVPDGGDPLLATVTGKVYNVLPETDLVLVTTDVDATTMTDTVLWAALVPVPGTPRHYTFTVDVDYNGMAVGTATTVISGTGLDTVARDTDTFTYTIAEPATNNFIVTNFTPYITGGRNIALDGNVTGVGMETSAMYKVSPMWLIDDTSSLPIANSMIDVYGDFSITTTIPDDQDIVAGLVLRFRDESYNDLPQMVIEYNAGPYEPPAFPPVLGDFTMEVSPDDSGYYLMYGNLGTPGGSVSLTIADTGNVIRRAVGVIQPDGTFSFYMSRDDLLSGTPAIGAAAIHVDIVNTDGTVATHHDFVGAYV